jgi:hypothetical protein
VQNFPVKEQQSTEGMVLGGGGHVFVDCQVSEKGFDLGSPISAGWRLLLKTMKRLAQST